MRRLLPLILIITVGCTCGCQPPQPTPTPPAPAARDYRAEGYGYAASIAAHQNQSEIAELKKQMAAMPCNKPPEPTQVIPTPEPAQAMPSPASPDPQSEKIGQLLTIVTKLVEAKQQPAIVQQSELPPLHPRGQFNWLSSIDEAKAECQRTGKQALIYYTTGDQCANCIKLERQVFTNGPVQNLMDDFVLAKIVENGIPGKSYPEVDAVQSNWSSYYKFDFTLDPQQFADQLEDARGWANTRSRAAARPASQSVSQTLGQPQQQQSLIQDAQQRIIYLSAPQSYGYSGGSSGGAVTSYYQPSYGSAGGSYSSYYPQQSYYYMPQQSYYAPTYYRPSYSYGFGGYYGGGRTMVCGPGGCSYQ